MQRRDRNESPTTPQTGRGEPAGRGDGDRGPSARRTQRFVFCQALLSPRISTLPRFQSYAVKMPTRRKGHGWIPRLRCSTLSHSRGRLLHAGGKGQGRLRLRVTLPQRFRQTSAVAGDSEKAETAARRRSLCVRSESSMSGCFLRGSHSEVCRCLSSALSSQGGRVACRSWELRHRQDGQEGPRPRPARSLLPPPPPVLVFLKQTASPPPLPFQHRSRLSRAGKSLQRPPDTHAPVCSEYLPGFLEVAKQRCLVKVFWNILSACYKIVENYGQFPLRDSVRGHRAVWLELGFAPPIRPSCLKKSEVPWPLHHRESPLTKENTGLAKSSEGANRGM